MADSWCRVAPALGCLYMETHPKLVYLEPDPEPGPAAAFHPRPLRSASPFGCSLYTFLSAPTLYNRSIRLIIDWRSHCVACTALQPDLDFIHHLLPLQETNSLPLFHGWRLRGRDSEVIFRINSDRLSHPVPISFSPYLDIKGRHHLLVHPKGKCSLGN